MIVLLPDAEDRTILSSFVWTKHRNVTDIRTDRSAVAITVVCTVSNADAVQKFSTSPCLETELM